MLSKPLLLAYLRQNKVELLLKSLPTTKHLDCADIELPDQALLVLGKVLSQCPLIESLDLSHNN